MRVDERILEEPDRWVQSACVLCSNGCAMDVGVTNGRIVGVRGRAVDRVNRGRLGPKGLHGWIANHSRDRLKKPLVRRFGKLRETTWDDAMEVIVSQSRKLKDEYGPGSIGFYNSGQLFLEEYYTLGVIARAEIRTPHIDGNTRRRFAAFVEHRLNVINVLRDKYGASSAREPQMVRKALFHGIRAGGLGVMRDLHDLSMLAN